jgi:hypothetical protein
VVHCLQLLSSWYVLLWFTLVYFTGSFKKRIEANGRVTGNMGGQYGNNIKKPLGNPTVHANW